MNILLFWEQHHPPARLVAGFGVVLGLHLGLGGAPAHAAPQRWQQAPAQTATPITGRVLDEKGEPLPGVNVVVKNANVGTATNLEG
ncbi:MAG: hypothetical protein EOO56_04575 [Hymenobacter sp.]|nr:MAG: hypothetical protein EOO56_04575 [Hymenobacter sp.]